MSGKFRDCMYCRQSKEYLASSVSDCKPEYPPRFTATFSRRNSTSSPWVVVNIEVVPSAWQLAAACDIIHQRIIVSTSSNCIASCAIFSQNRHLAILSYSHDWKGHWKGRPSLCWHWSHSDGRDKTAVAFQRMLFKTASNTSRIAGSGALM